jgi:general secretion pathway protein M
MTWLPFSRIFTRENLAGISYLLVLLASCFMTLLALMDLMKRYHERGESLEMLAQLQERSRPATPAPDSTHRNGQAPFLQGLSITLASASLLQHLSNAITTAGGSVISTEIESQDTHSREYLKASATCELDQVAVQRLLYDIESGAPFLFVDQLFIQPAMEEGRLRVVLGVSGMWLAAR